MAFIKSFDKTRLYYRFSRKGNRALVFIHGWAHNHTVWKNEAIYFANKGYSVLTMDLRGHGRSDAPSELSSYKMENFARDIHIIINKKMLIRPVLVGHSFGGMIVLKFLEMYPNAADAAVLIDSTYHNPLKDIGFFSKFRLTPLTVHMLKFILKHKNIQKRHFKGVDFSKMKDHSDLYYFLKGAESTHMNSIASCLMEMLKFDSYHSLGSIRIPTLIIEGDADHSTPMKIARKMHKAIRKSGLAIIKDAAHDTNLISPECVNRTMYDFLKKNNVTP